MNSRCATKSGIDIMVNEHHSTATCMTVSVPMALAIIARETKKSRLLSLGNPIANRPDPVRVAEEMAWLDCLSGGRLEMGLVKGAPYEIAPANSNPGAADAAVLGSARPDPEGNVHHHRPVQLGRRILPLSQRQHLAAADPAADTAGLDDRHERRYRHAWPPNEATSSARCCPAAPPNRCMTPTASAPANSAGRPARIAFAYAAIIGVGHTTDEGLRRADIIADYVRTAPVVAEPFTNPPGYNSIAANTMIMKGGPRANRFVTDRHGEPINHRTASVQQFMDTETVFAGTPDEVFEQIKTFNARMGGVGHLLFFGQGGLLTHQDAMDNIRCSARKSRRGCSSCTAPSAPPRRTDLIATMGRYRVPLASRCGWKGCVWRTCRHSPLSPNASDCS